VLFGTLIGFRDGIGLPREISIIHSDNDSEFALRLAKDLQSRGMPVWIDEFNLVHTLEGELRSQARVLDAVFYIVLLSPSMVEGTMSWLPWAIEKMIPVVVALYQECEVPPILAPAPLFDFTWEYDHPFERMLLSIRFSRGRPTETE
jgi:hypothetical protein